MMVRRFPVRYERLGFRLGLSWDDQICCIGCYSTYGLAGYSAQDGREVWRRKDLRQVQQVAPSELEDWVFCGRESGAAYLLRASTGETLEQLRGVKGVFASPFDRSVILAARYLELHHPFGTKRASFERSSKFLRTVAFSPSAVVISEANCLRCYHLMTGELLWSHEASGDGFYPAVAFHEELGCFVGLESHKQFVFFELSTGAIRRVVSPAEAPGIMARFCRRGSELISINLLRYSSETGQIIHDLATPELLAWDPEAKMKRLKALAESGRTFEDLKRYVEQEGFSKADAFRVLFMKTDFDRKQQKT